MWRPRYRYTINAEGLIVTVDAENFGDLKHRLLYILEAGVTWEIVGHETLREA